MIFAAIVYKSYTPQDETMKSKTTTSVAGKVLTTSNGKHGAKSIAASALTQRSLTKSLNVTNTSGKVIVRSVATHRDALKRLADR